jgi:hypothetical protein
MIKYSIRRGIDIVVLILALSIFTGCASRNSKQLSSVPRDIINHIVDTVLIHHPYTSQLLIASKYTCTSCVERVIGEIAQKSLQDSTIIVILGAGKPYLEKMDFFYRRQKIHFFNYPYFADSLLSMSPIVGANVLIGVNLRGGIREIYDGLDHSYQGVLTADSVLKFLLSP